MPFDINRFSTNINTYGTLKTSKFDINITPPRILLNSGNISGLIKFRAEQISLPSINIDLTSVNRYGIGPKQKFATNVSYSETVSISFLEVEDGMIQRCMLHWMNSIFSFDQKQPLYRIPPYVYVTQYKDDIATIIEVIQYTDDARIGNKIGILDAFPVNLSVSPLSWAETNALVKVKVEFAFTEWRNLNPCTEEADPRSRETDEFREYLNLKRRGMTEEFNSPTPITPPVSVTPPVSLTPPAEIPTRKKPIILP